MLNNLVELVTWNSSVLSGLGQTPASRGDAREISWYPQYGANQVSNANYMSNNEGPLINSQDITFNSPGGEFFLDLPTTSGHNTITAVVNTGVVVTPPASQPGNYTIGLSTDAGDYGSGAGSVGDTISNVVTNEVGGVGIDLIKITAAPSIVDMSSTTSTVITVRAYKYACQHFVPASEGAGAASFIEGVTGFFYDFYSLISSDLIDNEVTTGSVATLTIRPYDTNTIVIGRKFNGGSGYALGGGNAWYGAALPNFNVACS